MITPDFNVSQDTDNVFLDIKIKYIKTCDIQVDVQDSEFKLYANPYFLRLCFPGNLEQEGSVSNYNMDTGILHLQLKKQESGEFKDFEFNLLKKCKIVKNAMHKIQDLSLDLDELVKQEEIDWDSPQIIHVPSLEKKYGFNLGYSGLGLEFESVSREMLEIENIDSIHTDFKHSLHTRQDEKFDLDYFLEDLNDGVPLEIKEFKSEYAILLQNIQKGISTEILNGRDIVDLGNMKSRDFLLDNPVQIYLGLVDLMFSFSYNYLINVGEDNSESAWNLVKVSGTLSCFVQFDSLQEVVISCFRSSLSWPLLRRFDFSSRVLKHTAILFKLGKKGIAKALLEMKRILEGDDRCFTISQIWINDYIAWIQSKTCSEKTISSLSSKLNHFEIQEDDLQLYSKTH